MIQIDNGRDFVRFPMTNQSSLKAWYIELPQEQKVFGLQTSASRFKCK